MSSLLNSLDLLLLLLLNDGGQLAIVEGHGVGSGGIEQLSDVGGVEVRSDLLPALQRRVE